MLGMITGTGKQHTTLFLIVFTLLHALKGRMMDDAFADITQTSDALYL